MISLIWAMDENNLIGNGNELPWRIPAELQYFKKTTMGHPIAMGRKTFASIGRPLPGRENIIITRNKQFKHDNCTVFNCLEDFINYAKNYEGEIFVIGGAEIYKELLPYAQRLYVTKINHAFNGDTYFPQFDETDWKLIYNEKGLKNKENPYNYNHLIYERK